MKRGLVVFFFLISVLAEGQITFQKNYGGLGHDESFFAQQTFDNGYFLSGIAVMDSTGFNKVYLIKTNFKGDILWTRTFEIQYEAVAYHSQQTSDSGYIITGSCHDLISNTTAVLLIKTDSLGNVMWGKRYDSPDEDRGLAVEKTDDGGYIICGSNNFWNLWDISVVKLNSIGDTIWTKSYSTSGEDVAYSIKQTFDNGYIIAGYVDPFGPGSKDGCLIKIDSLGNIIWSKTIGGNSSDIARSVEQTSDSGYIICGYTGSYGAGGSDIYFIKTDSSANILWTKTFGNIDDEYARACHSTSDGGYILSASDDMNGSYLVKTDSLGNIIWNKLFSTASYHQSFSVSETSDNGYFLSGYYLTPDSFNNAYLIKTDSLGNSGCNESSPSLFVLSDSGFVTNVSFNVSTLSPIVSIPNILNGQWGNANLICQTLQIDKNDYNYSAILVCPNPAPSNSSITFTYSPLSHPSEIIINNINGEEVARYALPQWSSTQTVKLPDLAAGVYVARLISNFEFQISNVKFVVE